MSVGSMDTVHIVHILDITWRLDTPSHGKMHLAEGVVTNEREASARYGALCDITRCWFPQQGINDGLHLRSWRQFIGRQNC